MFWPATRAPRRTFLNATPMGVAQARALLAGLVGAAAMEPRAAGVDLALRDPRLPVDPHRADDRRADEPPDRALVHAQHAAELFHRDHRLLGLRVARDAGRQVVGGELHPRCYACEQVHRVERNRRLTVVLVQSPVLTLPPHPHLPARAFYAKRARYATKRR